MPNLTTTATLAKNSSRFATRTGKFTVKNFYRKFNLLTEKDKTKFVGIISSFSFQKKNSIFATGKLHCKKLGTGTYQLRWANAETGASALAYGSSLQTAMSNLKRNYNLKYAA